MNKHAPLLLLGPGSLFAALVLLLYKTGFLLARPVWVFGLCISIALACFISYLIFKEVLAYEKNLVREKGEKAKESQSIRGILDEAQALNREKVEKLEVEIASIEAEQTESLEEKEKALVDLKLEYDQLNAQSMEAHTQSNDFHTSLEDALEEIHSLRQIHYLVQEREKEIPKDLVNQHNQLREQFDEKSMILDQTRRRLFVIEGHLHAIKQQTAMDKLESHTEEENLVHVLRELEEENQQLEKEIQALESVVSQSLNPSKIKKSTKKLEEILEFQFDKTTWALF